MKSLALEREYGTGGDEIGKRIAELENLPFYDERTIIEEAGKLGYELSLLKNYEENRKESTLYAIAMMAKRKAELKIEIEKNMTKLSHELKSTIEYLNSKGPAVFVGLGVAGIVDNYNEFVRIYLNASIKEDRIRYIRKQKEIYKDFEIKSLIERKDKQRSIYFRYLTQKDWTDEGSYDYVYDICKNSCEGLCKTIIKNMRQ